MCARVVLLCTVAVSWGTPVNAGLVLGEGYKTFFLESLKGQRGLPGPACKLGGVGRTRGYSPDYIPALIVRDHHQKTADLILEKVEAKHIERALKPLIDPESVLCTDGASVHAAFARKYEIQHEAIRARGPRVALSQPSEELDGAVSWSNNQISEELPGMMADAGALFYGLNC